MSVKRYENKRQPKKIAKYEDYSNKPKTGAILQGPGLNRVAEYTSKTFANSQMNPATGKMEITHPTDHTHMLQFSSANTPAITPGVKKLLPFIGHKFNEINAYGMPVKNKWIEFRVEEYARDKGEDIYIDPSKPIESERKRIKSVLQEVRKGLIRDIEFLYDCSVRFEEDGFAITHGKRIKTDNDNREFRFFGDKNIRRGKVSLELTSGFSEYYRTAYVIDNYEEYKHILALDERNENLTTLGYKLFVDYNIHISKKKNKHKPFLRKVSSLLKITTYPTHEEVMNSNNRSWRKRIQTPFEKCLDDLVDSKVIKGWEYCKAKGEPLSDKEIDISSYDEFSGLNVKFTFNY